MHCYQTLAAAALVGRIIESLPRGKTGMPPAAVADWMEASGIDLDDVLGADPDTLHDQVAALVDREARRNLRIAA